MSSPINIGTSGWNYDHWKGPFYPPELPRKQWLSHYLKFFQTIEINNSFYQLPRRETFEEWHDTTPEGFIFAVKGSRYITHMKKLKDPEEPIERFMGNVRGLKDKLGPILFQLPPRWMCNPERLMMFLAVLPEDCRYAMEFRDDTWWHPEVYEILRSRNIAFCIFELAGRHTPFKITTDFVYIRLHGPGDAYQGQYDDQSLSRWAKDIRKFSKDGLPVYIYFDNDENGYAAQDALRLKEKVNA
jgi:uncharacterized protein YecE (DUF72 family)